jgi:hypothetical protein
MADQMKAHPLGRVELTDEYYAVVFAKHDPGKPPSEEEVAAAIEAVKLTFSNANSWSDVSELP